MKKVFRRMRQRLLSMHRRKIFNKNDAQKVIDYLQKAEKRLSWECIPETEMPNFASILDTYG